MSPRESTPSRPRTTTPRSRESEGVTDAALDSRSLGAASDDRGGDLAEHLAHSIVRARLFGVQASPPTIGRYELQRDLGAGGGGMVFAARDPELDRAVAIKLLHGGRGEGESDAARQARMVREAQALARLAHPNVVAIFDVGTYEAPDDWPLRKLVPDRGVFIAMELVDGVDLRSWLATPRSVASIVAVFVAAGRGLQAAHAAGLVHRDFKPSNVLVASGDPPSRVCVVDFGLARSLGAAPASGAAVAFDQGFDGRTLTASGWVMGTPVYMAPEQHEGHGADARSDQFSFCVALYEALFGVRPFRGRTVGELRASKRAGAITAAIAAAPVPAAVTEALRRGLATDPDARWPDMAALLAVLERAIAPRRAAAVPWLLGLGTVAAAALLWPRDHATACDAFARTSVDVATRERVGAALAATGVAYSDAAARRVGAALVQFDQRWSSAIDSVCAGVPEPAAIACLRDDERQLRAFVEVMQRADDTVARNAGSAADALPDPRRCSSARAQGSPPSTAGSPEHDGLRDRLARVAAATAAGRVGEARTEAEAVLRDAEALGDPRLVAAALVRRAAVQFEAGEWAAAEAGYGAAYWSAGEVGDDATGGEAALRLASVVLERGARMAEAQTWIAHAAAAIERAGGEPLQRARLEAVRSILAYERGEYVAAVDAARRALALFREVLPEEDLRVQTAVGNLAAYLLSVGETDEAEALQRRVLEYRRAALGESHPDVAQAENVLAAVLANANRPADAEALLRAAIEHWQASFGAEHPLLAMPYNNLGLVQQALGRDDEAIASLQRSIAIRVAVLPADHPDLAQTRANLAASLVAAEQFEQAQQQAQDALDSLLPQLGDAAVGTALARTSLGMALLELGRPEDARTQLEAAVAALQGGAELGLLARAQSYLGGALVELGRDREAIAALSGALSRGEAHGAADRVRAQVWLARARRSDGVDDGTALLDAAQRDLDAGTAVLSSRQRARLAAMIAAARAAPPR